MKIIKYVLPIAILNLIAIVLATLGLPDIVPLHISLDGTVNLYGSKWAIPLIGLIPISLVILFDYFGDYFAKSIENKEIMDKLIPILAFFFMFIPWILVIMGYANSISLNRLVIIFISALLGVIFIIIGYLMLNVKQNNFMGFRNKWTLTNEIVWRKTNKLASYLLLIGGSFILVSSIATLITNNTAYVFVSLMIGILLIAIVPTVYSCYKFNNVNN